MTDEPDADEAFTPPEQTAFQRDILGVILKFQIRRFEAEHEGTPYGAEIRRVLELAYRETYGRPVEIHDPRLYGALSDLHDAGLVERESVSGGKKVYSLTDSGRHRIADRTKWFSPRRWRAVKPATKPWENDDTNPGP